MPRNVAQKLLAAHRIEGEMQPGAEIGLRIDQTLTQDATGTLAMLELEAMGLDCVRTEVSVQYVDHNLLQEDHKNPDDHRFLQSACQRFHVWFSRPGNGVSHPLHQERFGIPGKSLLGSDSHTCAAGAIGMLAMGAGRLEVAMAMAGEPFYMSMPLIWGVHLYGEMQPWVSAKDIILEMLRRHRVNGGIGRLIEYYVPGLTQLSAMDRHVIANMGAELGATASVFPSDGETRRFLKSQGREDDWREIMADEGAGYDQHEEIDLSKIEPLVALPSSPDNVHSVRSVAGQPIAQAYLGSSANPGYRDFAIAARIVAGKTVHPSVSFDINPTSRQILENLIHDGQLQLLLHAGARIHQAGCNGCIGMGQAPATDAISLRTVPRNFPRRSGTREDHVYLVSPETAAASALRGQITDPRTLSMPYPALADPQQPLLNQEMFQPPPPANTPERIPLAKGPNIISLPTLGPLPPQFELPVLLRLGNDVSTDEIMPAGSRVLPFRSNIPRISEFVFEQLDATYYRRACAAREKGGHFIVAGENYGQGSSREHAALAPRFLGLRAVIAKSFSRIHWQNLTNFGVVPLTFCDATDYDTLATDDLLRIEGLFEHAELNSPIYINNITRRLTYQVRHNFSPRQCALIKAGGLINLVRRRRADDGNQ